MSDDEEALLKVVLAVPEDEGARLVYADAVQERTGDEARAALIRARFPCLVCRTVGTIAPPFLGTSTPSGEPLDSDRYLCHRCDGSGWRPFCEEPGCRNPGRVCILDGHIEHDGEEIVDHFCVDHFCEEHAASHGYCPVCGSFWGGIGTFEVNGICDHCRDQIGGDDGFGDDEYEAEDYDGDHWPDEF